MLFSRPRASCWLALFLSTAPAIYAHAAGFGQIAVRSGLGQPLRANLPLLGEDSGNYDAHCLTSKVESLDGASVFPSTAELARAQGATLVHLRTAGNINEPVLNIVVALGCGTAVHRDYQILLDPVSAPAALAPTAPPALLAASAPAAPAAKHVAPAGATHPVSGIAPAPKAFTHAHSRRHPKRRQPGHSVLRLSTIDPADGYRERPLRLRRSDTLTLSVIAPAPAADAAPADTTPTTAPSQEELLKEAQTLMKGLQAQAEALRIETARIKQQDAFYRNALEATRNESMNWIKGLSALLAVCVAAVGWLLWRIIAMKQNAPHPWHELFTQQDINTIDSTLMEGNTGFGTTSFDMTEISTEEFQTTASSPSDMLTPTELRAHSIDPASTIDGLKLASRTEERAGAPAKPPRKPRPTRNDLPVLNGPWKNTEIPIPETIQMIKAEEISDVMELVDVWMTMNAPEKVLELLKPFGEIEQPESPLPWLCLLDVYRALGDKQKYEAILERIKSIFNVKLAPWTPPPYSEPPKTLADFPHVIDEVASRWRSDELLPYLKGLLRDDRDGTRHGFDLPVYRDILQLITLAGAPERLQRRDRIMPEKAYQILFGPRPSEPPEQAAPKAVTQEASAPELPKTRLRERPKYTPPSYEQRIRAQHGNDSPLPKTKAAEAEVPQDTAAPATQAAVRTLAIVTDENKPTRHESPSEHPPLDNDMSPMAIKLHLAIAYQDIGDKEGACLLLDEVINDGTPEQSEQARRMLTKLA